MSENKSKIFFNRKAKYNYEIIQKFEAGLVLNGNEIRSIREGKVVLENSYAVFKKNELWILNLFVDLKSFKNSKVENQDDVRPKKLLLTRKQLDKIAQILRANNFTVIPFDLHFNKKGFLKVNIAISKGRKKEDLREYKKQQDWKREKQKMERKG